MKLIIFVYTCKAYEESRARLLENTWANNPDVVFITDNPKCTLKKYRYIGPPRTSFTYDPESLLNIFNICLIEYVKYDFYMIIDDDSYVYIDKLKNYLTFFDPKQPYMIGDFLNWPHLNANYKYGGNYQHWVGGGAGIVFTKSTITEYGVLARTNNVQYSNHDTWLNDLYKRSDGRIKRVHGPGFHQYGAEYLYKNFSLEDNNLISIHLNHDMELLSNYHLECIKQ